MVPCVIFEDEHLLAVNKPAGWNTHSPSPFAGEGIYEWLRQREPRWASLAILHRLDKETSGVLVFGKTSLANRSLTEQFARRDVRKNYLLLTDREIPRLAFTMKSALIRVGDKYASRPGGEPAETLFVPLLETPFSRENSRLRLARAEPLTGRTHQIRVHAAENGFPILGDTLYGGTAAPRVFLHAAGIAFRHPATNAPVALSAPDNFEAEPRLALRASVIDPETTNAFRLIHGASDGWSGGQVDKLGGFLLSQSEAPLSASQQAELVRLAGKFSARGAYHKRLTRHVRQATPAETSPQLVWGEPAPAPFEILENGVRYELNFNEGYSTGLFLDQRDNRRRWLTGHVAADFQLPMADGRWGSAPPVQVQGPKAEIRNPKPEILNVFAYTCAFSVCAAMAGARVASLDLSRKYLEWGRRNFALNGLASGAHDFIYGDAFDWLRRLAKKGRRFDAVVLDPPTFSQSKQHGVFRVERDLGDLVAAAVRVLPPGGVLLVSANTAGWEAEQFVASVESGLQLGKRAILKRHYVPQPPDFPISRAEPAHFKSLWLQID
jgi:23S rRNA (cytosine1962-C5)-methyltransferase